MVFTSSGIITLIQIILKYRYCMYHIWIYISTEWLYIVHSENVNIWCTGTRRTLKVTAVGVMGLKQYYTVPAHTGWLEFHGLVSPWVCKYINYCGREMLWNWIQSTICSLHIVCSAKVCEDHCLMKFWL